MSDQEDNFHNNEEYEENENMEDINQGEEQYEEENMNENGEEEGQGVFAFDIQINDEQFLLVIGKTDENKLLIRLIDKEDENKPFFQNEFSLDDLRNINPFFNNIEDENIVFQYIISNLNDADKEIKIVDQDRITLILIINEDDEKIVIPFELYKTIEVEGDEEENMMEMNGQPHGIEGNLEEGVEVMQHDIGEDDLAPGEEGEQQIEEAEIEIKNLDGNEEINEDHPEEENNNLNIKGNVKISTKGKAEEKLSSNLPLQIGGQPNVKSTIVEKKEISNENGVETIIQKKEVTKITSPSQNQPVPEIKKEITIIKETKVEPDKSKEREKLLSQTKNNDSQKPEKIIQNNNNEDILLLREELLKTIDSLNENFNNQLLKQSESFTKMKNEMKEESDNKIKEMSKELNKKINDLNDMKNKYENMNKKMDDIQNTLNENKKLINGYEGKINEINNKVNNLSEQIANINSLVNEQIEKNNKKLMDDINNLSKKMNEKLAANTNSKKDKNEPTIVQNGNQEELNEFRTNLSKIEEQIEKIKKDIENNKNNGENNFKSFKKEMNDINEKIKHNHEALLNINNNNDGKGNENINEELNNRMADFENVINDIEAKINNLENDLKNMNTKKETNKNDNLVNKLNEDINNKLASFENTIKNLGSKVKNLENNLNNNQANPQQESNNQYDEKIFELENITKDIESRINDYDFDKLIQNISFLMEKANDAEVLKKINNLETRINQIKDKVNKPDTSNRSNDISPELINRINELENSIQLFGDEFQKIENQNKNNYNSTNNLDKKTNNLEKKLANISKLSEDLQNKTETLFKVSKNLENITKDLDKRTYDIMNNLNKMPSAKEPSNINKNLEKLRNIKKNNNNNTDIRVRQEKNYGNNMPIEDNRGIQKGFAANYGKGKRLNENINNNVIETNNGYQIMIKTKENIYNNKQQMSNPRNYEETYSHTLQPGMINKFNYIDSKIVDYDDIIFLTNRLREMHPKINNVLYNLVYRASEDGDKASDFHSKCDKIGPNITLIKTKKGFVFGGFTFKNWEHMPRDIDPNKPNLGSASRDSRAFGFSVNNQKIYNNEKPNEFAIWCNRNFGPTFKNNLFQIFDSCLKKGGYCSIKSNSHFGGQNYDYEISGGESRFKVEELEVYEVKL